MQILTIGELRLVQNRFYALDTGAIWWAYETATRLIQGAVPVPMAATKCPRMRRIAANWFGTDRRRRHLLKPVQAAWHKIRASVV